MKRLIVRAAVMIALFLAAVAVAVVLQAWLPRYWGGGIAGGLGAMIALYAPGWFDRRWPKPKAGWAE